MQPFGLKGLGWETRLRACTLERTLWISMVDMTEEFKALCLLGQSSLLQEPPTQPTARGLLPAVWPFSGSGPFTLCPPLAEPVSEVPLKDQMHIQSHRHEGLRFPRTCIQSSPHWLSTSNRFVISYSKDWGRVLEEHLHEMRAYCKIEDLTELLEDFTVTDRDGFELDLVRSACVPDPSRFPLYFMWKGLPEDIAQQCQLSTEVMVEETHLEDMAF
eukprot:TRINITY_DN102326_c0_g1_i1.p1 TRINITY_DN102326_c0_g1~~TRINITY_DN102326_c0_g1_i1.p1  ORF type:complete len:216 (+),score=21.84 TRINITY_DN102326_c0_g1_i1:97-744(+)